ncbi:MAG: AbrB/MazE/SpoVT family DNA-binding domain-containing protein [Propionicimonas sp.]
MSGSHALVMGDRGRLVIPADVRAAAHLEQGTKLILITSESGLVLLTVDQVRARLKEQLAGRDLVAELLAERRAEAAADSA